MNNIFIECFENIEDPRINRTKKHLLMDIIALTLFAIMSGAQTFDEIEEFGKDYEEWLKKYLFLPNGIPSHDTINRVLSLLDPEILQKSFLQWIIKVKGYVVDNVIAIDGKTMKASHQNNKGLKALHLLNAYSCANGLSIGQMKVDGKTNEITAIPELLEQLAIQGAIITIVYYKRIISMSGEMINLIGMAISALSLYFAIKWEVKKDIDKFNEEMKEIHKQWFDLFVYLNPNHAIRVAEREKRKKKKS